MALQNQGDLRAARSRHRFITLDTYSHAIPAMQNEAATKIAALVFACSDEDERGETKDLQQTT
jgi:hypothetical protein